MSKGFDFSRLKIEYLECKFSKKEGETIGEITIVGIAILRVEKFIYLGFIIHCTMDMDEDVSRQKWRSTFGV